MLLTNLHAIAIRLQPYRRIFLLLALLGLLSGVYAAISTQDTFSWQLRLSMVFALWSLMLFAFIQLFHTIPGPVLPKLGFFERFRDRAILFLYRALALFIAVLTVLMLQMSLKLILVQS